MEIELQKDQRLKQEDNLGVGIWENIAFLINMV